MDFESAQGQLQLPELSLFSDEPPEALRPARPAKKGSRGANPVSLDPAQQAAAEAAAQLCDQKTSKLVEVDLGGGPAAAGRRKSLRINAVAGSGKSRCLVGTVGEMGRWDGLLLSTFNKAATLELDQRVGELYPELIGGRDFDGYDARTVNSLGDSLIRSHFNGLVYVAANKKELSPGEVRRPLVPKGESVELDAIYFDDTGDKYAAITRQLVDHEEELAAVLPRGEHGPDISGLLRLLRLTFANLQKHPSSSEVEDLVAEHGLRFNTWAENWLDELSAAITAIQKRGIRMLRTPYRYQTKQNKQKAGWHIYRGIYSYEDQVWAPFYLDLSTSKLFSRALVDEYQDLSIAQFDVLLRCLEPDAPVILYGDIRQTIYGFNGAGLRVRNWLDAHLPGSVLELNDCYRCPEAVLAIARHFNPKIRRAALAGPDAPGSRAQSLDIDGFLEEIAPGDVVLARTNSALIRAAMRYAISRGIGEDGKLKGARVIIRKDKGFKGRLVRTVHEVREAWYKHTGQDRLRFRTEFQLALNHYAELKEAQRKEAEEAFKASGDPTQARVAECVRAVLEEVAMISAFYEVAHDRAFGADLTAFQNFMVNSVLHQDDNAKAELTGGIEFRTVHTMKGAEADRVFVVDLGTTYFWHTDSQREELRNIRYVCLTRARRELFLVKGFVDSMEQASVLLDHPVPRPEG